MPLKAEKNNMTRGIPEHYLATLDGMLTNRYKDINAKVTVPPLSLAFNNQQTSQTNDVTFTILKAENLSGNANTIQLLGKHITYNCNNRSGTQFDIGRHTHTT